ncbi:MAG TPA: DUF4159 domain-containing protein [Terriglobales bacterium]|jgi:hypothetical protein|nr:DUF4159 domain-containing protein [Terriglobales bacterium]
MLKAGSWFRKRWSLIAAACLIVTTCVLALQVPTEFQEDPEPPPADGFEKTEWAFARLRYPEANNGYRRPFYSWSIDSSKADRLLSQALRRLSRVHVRSMEEVVDLDSDEIYNWPWIYAVEAGHWQLTDDEASRLRKYLLRGGFLMVDDFHGTREWAVFMASMSRVFPDRLVADIPGDDPIFHVVYDLKDRFQVPGAQYLQTGRRFEQDGFNAEWKGIYDDHGRLMVAICHNMDLGDAWEWADSPIYPEQWASMAIRIGVNYVTYAMTH